MFVESHHASSDGSTDSIPEVKHIGVGISLGRDHILGCLLTEHFCLLSDGFFCLLPVFLSFLRGQFSKFSVEDAESILLSFLGHDLLDIVHILTEVNDFWLYTFGNGLKGSDVLLHVLFDCHQ